MGRGGDGFYSPEDQRRAIEGWAQSHDCEIVVWHEDLDQSGRSDDRPGFQAMLSRVKRGETGGVVVAKLDRLSRSVANGLAAIKTTTDAGLLFVSVAEGIDPTTRFGKLNMTIVLAMAEWFSDGIKEGWESTLDNAVARGAWPNRWTPFGYSKRDDKTLEPHPFEAAYLRGIFERRADGVTWQRIADWLNAEGAKPRRADEWIGGTVKDIVQHEVYLGVVAKQGFRNDHAHEPLVDRALWTRARNVHAIRPPAINGSNAQRYLLTGIVRCAGCGYALAPTTAKPSGKPAVDFYACKRRHGSGRCPTPATISANVVHAYVERVFLAMVEHGVSSASADAPALADAESALADAEAAREDFAVDLEARSLLGDSAWRAGLRARAAAVDSAQQNVATARREATGVDLPDAVTLKALWPSLSVPERRELIAAGVDVIFVRQGRGMAPEDKTRVIPKGEAPTGLPRKGVSAPIREFGYLFT